MKNLKQRTFGLRAVFGIIAIMAIIGFSMAALSLTGCGGGAGGGATTLVEEQWGTKYEYDPSTKVEYSVDANGVCTITVTGTPATDIWKTSVHYIYNQRQGASYVYTFEAWTQTGTGNRELVAGYFENYADQVFLKETIQITEERKTYTIYGATLPRLGEGPAIRFECANKLGTFYIKITKIEEYTIGKLTVTNFSGANGLTQGMDVYGSGFVNDSNIHLVFCTSLSFGEDYWNQSNVTITGNTITIPVWKLDYDNNTVEPYTGNITIPAGYLSIEQWNHTANGEWTGTDSYVNTVPITFANGNANINFRTQMGEGEGEGYEEGGPAAPEPQITITGITGKTGNVSMTGSSTGDMNENSFMGQGTISGNSAQIIIHKYGGSNTPFTSGSYYLNLIFSTEDTEEIYVYTDGRTFESLDITSVDDMYSDDVYDKLPTCYIPSLPFIINFSQFTKAPDSWWEPIQPPEEEEP